MNGYNYSLDWHDGVICVVYVDYSWSRPEKVVQWWPTTCRCSRKDAEDFLGTLPVPCQQTTGDSSLGLFSAKPRPPYERGQRFQLVNGGSTKPIRTDVSEVPKPNSKKELRWYRGYWQKLLKKGWVAA